MRRLVLLLLALAGCAGGDVPPDVPVGSTGKADGLGREQCRDVGAFEESQRLALGDRTVRVDAARAHLRIESARGALQLGPVYVDLDGQRFVASRIEEASVSGDTVTLLWRIANHRAHSTLTLAGDGIVHFAVDHWGGIGPSRAGLLLPSAADEHFFGFGERFNAFDQAGRVVAVHTSDHAGDKGDHAYKAAPFYVSSRGHGVHFDTALDSRFDLRSGSADCVAIDHDDMALAFDFVEGPRPTDVLGRWTALVGRPHPMAQWAYGPWISSDVWRSGGEVRYVVEEYARRQLPASVFVFDSPWAIAYNDFHFNESQFAAGADIDGQHWEGFSSTGEMMSFLRAHGLRVVLWMTPFVNVSSYDEGTIGANLGAASTWADGAARGLFVRGSDGQPLVIDWWKGRGSLLDFTNPAAVAWLAEQLRAVVDASGGVVSGWKTDAGESDYLPDSAVLFDGSLGWQEKNRYALDYQRAVASVLGEDGVLFARSGFVGAQALPAHWAGDNEGNFGDGNGLPSVIVAAQAAAMSGYVYWGSDIGGYLDTNPSSTPDNLFMRWAQFAAVTPIYAMHRQTGRGRVYPWSYGEEAFANYRQYAVLHTALQPYFRTLAVEAEARGLPMIRPLALTNSDDARSSAVRHVFGLGEWLLAAPMITNRQTTRTLLLPPGRWVSWWTDADVVGGDFVTVTDADQSHLPLFIKEGAIVPLLAEPVQTLNDVGYTHNASLGAPSGALSLLLVPGEKPTESTLFDGTKVTLERSANVVTIKVGPGSVTRLLVRATTAPSAVRIDGTEQPVHFADHRTQIELPASDATQTIEIE